MRHPLGDNRGFTWQVILFSGRDQLRLVGLPEQYHFRPPDPLVLITSSGQTLTAVDDFPKADTVANVRSLTGGPSPRNCPRVNLWYCVRP
ncbi:DUF3122 domain-containing protein [Thermosynechococcus sp. M55_K2018_012]|uniref:DUF3122 domain-containing protein n=1 Tax=Thermosynechococcus sp. M55_K2018_012 TaxID=2747809 RepID=UPI0019D8F78C|nr:DUF3122 domain-containing protein [Thermosynechococcus sp. M55_K2018_012]HIK34647.1 DUF3122 domain-containing protein [Thermosynechococcus sp. M98_K2018_005]HIK49282.1 DUF3122 domain-containing protein [Thermosynechococcus sp. M55_K2018_012]